MTAERRKRENEGRFQIVSEGGFVIEAEGRRADEQEKQDEKEQGVEKNGDEIVGQIPASEREHAQTQKRDQESVKETDRKRAKTFFHALPEIAEQDEALIPDPQLEHRNHAGQSDLENGPGDDEKQGKNPEKVAEPVEFHLVGDQCVVDDASRTDDRSDDQREEGKQKRKKQKGKFEEQTRLRLKQKAVLLSAADR